MFGAKAGAAAGLQDKGPAEGWESCVEGRGGEGERRGCRGEGERRVREGCRAFCSCRQSSLCILLQNVPTPSMAHLA